MDIYFSFRVCFITQLRFDFGTGWSERAIATQELFLPSLIFLDQDGYVDLFGNSTVRSSTVSFSFQVRGSFLMAASSSKARARPIPRDLSSSDESSHEVLIDSNILPRQHSLLSPRLPRLHSIKRPFKLVLGGILTHPRRSRTRKTEFKLIERLPDILRGQFRFQCQEGPAYRSLTLQAGPSSTGAWRKVFTSPEYPRLVFKLSPATEDLTLYYGRNQSIPSDPGLYCSVHSRVPYLFDSI